LLDTTQTTGCGKGTHLDLRPVVARRPEKAGREMDILSSFFAPACYHLTQARAAGGRAYTASWQHILAIRYYNATFS